MNAKHLSKFSISKKLAIFGAVIAVAIIAVFSICAKAQAIATTYNNSNDLNSEYTWQLQDGTEKCEDNLYSIFNNSGSFLCEGEWNFDSTNAFEIIDSNFSDIEFIKVSCSEQINERQKFLQIDLTFIIEGTYIGGLNSESNGLYYLRFSIKPIREYENVNYWWYLDNKRLGDEDKDEWTFATKSNHVFMLVDESTKGVSLSGFITDINDVWKPVAGAFVQYCRWSHWLQDYVPVPEMSTFTDWFGNYTIEGVTEDMLPGVIRVYRFGYEAGESAPIWFVPEGLDTIYRFIEMTPSEPPVPPTPPDPPVPPVPPQPDPPQPVPPTPVDPGTNVPQTGDNAAIALVIAGMLALCGACAFGACAKRRFSTWF